MNEGKWLYEQLVYWSREPEYYLQGSRYRVQKSKNTAKILAVVHLDVVGNKYPLKYTHDAQYRTITGIGLDDRLGLVGLQYLRMKGLVFDILFTTDEEAGSSTAREYAQKTGKDHEYNWIFELDRMVGYEQAVTYQYIDTEWMTALRKTVGNVGHGSFTDIVELGSMGVCAVNFCVGYKRQHSHDCHVMTQDFYSCMAKVEKFYNEYNGMKFAHKEQPVNDFHEYSRYYTPRPSKVYTYSSPPKTVNSVGDLPIACHGCGDRPGTTWAKPQATGLVYCLCSNCYRDYMDMDLNL